MPEWLLFASLPLLILSLTVHELAHGLVAAALGDPTARVAGRLTANPLKHLDTLGTIVLVGTLLASGGTRMFGWAKPVPVDPRHFKSQKKGMAIVGAAGPLSNVALALLAIIATRVALFVVNNLDTRIMAGADLWTARNIALDVANIFWITVLLNVILAVINLIPVPPLDGSKVLGAFLPDGLYRQWSGLDQYAMFGFLVLVALMTTGALRVIIDPFLSLARHLVVGWKW
jgi:Zn-dependent protease